MQVQNFSVKFLLHRQTSSVPRSWPIISQTKSLKRFRPPPATTGYDKILCARETRVFVSLKCWKAHLKLSTSVAVPLRTVVKSLTNLQSVCQRWRPWRTYLGTRKWRSRSQHEQLYRRKACGIHWLQLYNHVTCMCRTMCRTTHIAVAIKLP